MTTQTFTWVPHRSASCEATFRTRQAQFGDGYRQTAADGINNRTQSWQVSFVSRTEVITAIKTFLDARKGAEAFYWTPPFESAPRLFTAGSYSLQKAGPRVWTLSTTFEEAFQP